MDKKWIAVLIGVLLSINAFASEPEIEQKIEALNQESINSLGVSLNALTYLVGASGYSYIPLWHLKESGDIAHVRELEAAGYVKVTERKGLPDGTNQSEVFVNIVPLKTGKEVQRCIQALKHNNASKKGALKRTSSLSVMGAHRNFQPVN